VFVQRRSGLPADKCRDDEASYSHCNYAVFDKNRVPVVLSGEEHAEEHSYGYARQPAEKKPHLGDSPGREVSARFQ